MECPKCGSELPNDARFCGLCFAKLEVADSAAGPTDDVPVVAACERTPDVTPVTKALYVFLGSLIAVVLGMLLDLVPFPLLFLAAPFLGGMFVGRMAGNDGGRLGLISSIGWGIARLAAVVQASRALDAVMSAKAAQLYRSSGQMIKLPGPNMLQAGLVGAIPIVALGLFCGFLGGRTGERMLKGVGFGV